MKELAVQKYLRSGKSLINLNQDYKINFVINSEDNSVVLNYSPNTPIETDIVRESRALILDLDNWDVIAKSMDAFLIPSSLKTAEKIEYFDWNNAFATPKYDGCLMLLYFTKNEWKINMHFNLKHEYISKLTCESLTYFSSRASKKALFGLPSFAYLQLRFLYHLQK
jgi:hypothetical protein